MFDFQAARNPPERVSHAANYELVGCADDGCPSVPLSLGGCQKGGAVESQLSLPAGASARLVLLGERPIIEIFNHGPGSVQTQIIDGGEDLPASDQVLGDQMAWQRTFRGGAVVMITNVSDADTAEVELDIRNTTGIDIRQ